MSLRLLISCIAAVPLQDPAMWVGGYRGLQAHILHPDTVQYGWLPSVCYLLVAEQPCEQAGSAHLEPWSEYPRSCRLQGQTADNMSTPHVGRAEQSTAVCKPYAPLRQHRHGSPMSALQCLHGIQ